MENFGIYDNIDFDKKLIDNLNLSVIVVQNGVIRQANPNLLEVSGFASAELVGKGITNFVSPEQRDILVPQIQKCENGEFKRKKFEAKLLKKPGEWIVVEASALSVKYENAPASLLILNDIKKIAERKYQDILDIAPVGFIQTTPDGYIVLANDEMARILGYEKGTDLVYENVKSFYFNPQEREALYRNQEVIFSEGIKNVEVRFRTKYNKCIWILVSTKASISPNSNTLRYDSFIVDITERKESEAELIIKEQALASSLNAVSITDMEGNITYGNEAFIQLYGYEKEDFMGTPLYNYYHNGSIYEVIDELKDKGYCKGVEVAIRKDGSLFDVEYSASIIKDEKGKPVGMLATLIDITQRKKKEQEISRLYQAIGQSHSCVALCDLEGYFIYVNPKYCELSGYSKAELLGKHSNIFKSGKHSNQFYKDLWECITSGDTWKGEIVNKKKDGELFTESARISPVVNEEGVITHYIKASLDITKDIEIKAELIKSKEKAEESDRLKTAFLNNMSHEIRTPLNGMLGFIEFIVDPDYGEEEKKKFVSIVQKSSDRLLKTVSDIIDISKIEAGQVDLVVEDVCLNKTQNELLSLFAAEADAKGLSLHFLPTLSDKNSKIITDNQKFYGVLSNLIKNAIKFTDVGSIEFGYVLKQDILEFFVRDTGVGIPKNRQTAIFNRFEQADIQDTRAFEGSGLGLSIARSYVEMMGGVMWMSSTEGIGSEFKFTLPYKKTIHKAERIESETVIDCEKNKIDQFTVLIAEDERVNKQYFEIAFRDKFREMIFVETGEQAIATCLKNPDIDLVLMDIKMPEMNGIIATQEIRKFNSDIIIIAQTAYATIEDKEIALYAGCDDYITKPIKRELLFEIIASHIKARYNCLPEKMVVGA